MERRGGPGANNGGCFARGWVLRAVWPILVFLAPSAIGAQPGNLQTAAKMGFGRSVRHCGSTS